jgi:hypothetical protein
MTEQDILTRPVDLQLPAPVDERSPIYMIPAEIIRLFLRTSQHLCHDVEDEDSEWEDVDLDTEFDDQDSDVVDDKPRKPQLITLPSFDWLNLMNSCSFMRSTGLHAPELWATINLKNLKSAAAYLERSIPMSLSLYLPLGASTESFLLLLANFDRAREIEAHIKNNNYTMTEPLSQLLSGPCPILEGILIEGCIQPLLMGTFDRLTVVYFEDGEFCDREYPMIPSLKSLTLKDFYIDDGFDMLIGLLNGFPNLEDLTLIGHERLAAYESIRDLDDVKESRITITTLHSLKILSDVRTCGVFMRLFSDGLPSHHLSVKVVESDVTESSLAEQDNALYQKEIVTRARLFWKTVTGFDSFPDGRLRTRMTFDMSDDLEDNLATWWGEHDASGASVYIRTPVHVTAYEIHLLDCTTLQLDYAANWDWDLPAGRLSNLKRIIFLKPQLSFFLTSVPELYLWLLQRQESGQPLQSVEFHQYDVGQKVKRMVERVLVGLGVEVIWS